jgi:formate hydrogenlyase subunit 4
MGARAVKNFVEHVTPIFLALILSPLLSGIMNRTKAFFAGRKGFPLTQTYRDLKKLLGKGAVYSSSISWIFRLSPLVSVAVAIIACAWLPFGDFPGIVAFRGDFVAIAYFFGLARLMTALAALDTASPFEGMGANREVFFAVFAEPAVLLGFAAVSGIPGGRSFGDALVTLAAGSYAENGIVLSLVAITFFLLALSENSRIPVDDPTTHLELTMVHEAMILDNSGPDLAFIEYASGLKLWFYFALVADTVLPFFGKDRLVRAGLMAILMIVLPIIAGAIESSMARLRIMKVPQLLGSAMALSFVALLLKGIL